MVTSAFLFSFKFLQLKNALLFIVTVYCLSSAKTSPSLLFASITLYLHILPSSSLFADKSFPSSLTSSLFSTNTPGELDSHPVGSQAFSYRTFPSDHKCYKINFGTFSVTGVLDLLDKPFSSKLCLTSRPWSAAH